ncbi:MAG: vWA domain-containing protein [Candidatus Promineifilaceae bacterium]
MKHKFTLWFSLLILIFTLANCGSANIEHNQAPSVASEDNAEIHSSPTRRDTEETVAEAAEEIVEEKSYSEAVEGREAADIIIGSTDDAESVEVESETVEVAPVDGDTSYEPAPTQAAPVVPAEPESLLPESSAEPDTMIFDETDVNPFVDTRDDRFSTFAIDVDTGSYTLMRSYLSDYGQMPPEASVRVEEYVNYFNYDYPSPDDGAFGIELEAAPAPYGENENYHLMRVGIQGYEVPEDERPDTLLIFVIDVSGSMDQDNRIGLVKESLRLLVNSLRPTDRVGLVVYGSSARSVLDPTYITDDRTILNAIDNLYIEGATNVEDGITQGYRMANRYALDGQSTRLLVLSDGVANVGDTTADEILQNARRGISLSTFGFGMGNYNDGLMEQLADQGDGTYAYIDTLREAQRWFVTGLTSTLITIAKDAKIQVEFNPAVVDTYRLIGYENRAVADEDFRNDTVDAGEIGAGHSVTALYEVRLGEEVSAAEEALTVRVRYQDMKSGEVIEVARAIRPNEFATQYDDSSPSFQLAATVAEFGELLKDSYWARNSSFDAVWQDAEQLAIRFPRDRDVQTFVELVESAAAYAR